MSGYWVALLIAVGANVFANVALKLAVSELSLPLDARALLTLASVPWAWAGMASVMLLLVSYLIAIRGIALSIAYPTVTGLAMAGIIVSGCVVLSEPLSVQKITGVGLILTGILLLAQTQQA
jgi:multidrug transporter EmrE-like cation transporter